MEMDNEKKAWKKVSQWSPECDQSKFIVWVQRKAAALWERDKNKLIARGCLSPETNDNEKRAQYRQAIYKAIAEMEENVCPYTGYLLKWDKIGKWDNEEAKRKGKVYKRDFALLPTVDHKNADSQPDFIICSWEANDAKNDLPYDKFVELCRAVVALADKKAQSGPSGL